MKKVYQPKDRIPEVINSTWFILTWTAAYVPFPQATYILVLHLLFPADLLKSNCRPASNSGIKPTTISDQKKTKK